MARRPREPAPAEQDSRRVNTDPWTVEPSRAVGATLRTARNAERLDVEASAAAATLRGPAPGTVRVEWEPLRYIHSGGGATAPSACNRGAASRACRWPGPRRFGDDAALAEFGVSGDLLFDGDWDIDAGDTLHARARVARESRRHPRAGGRGRPGHAHQEPRHRQRKRTHHEREPATARPRRPACARPSCAWTRRPTRCAPALAWDSERAGEIKAQAKTRVVQRQGGWQWAADAPLAGRVTARLPKLGVWSILAPPGWRVAGTLEADATLSGNRTAPR